MGSFQKNLKERKMKEVLIAQVLAGSAVTVLSFATLMVVATFKILKGNWR